MGYEDFLEPQECVPSVPEAPVIVRVPDSKKPKINPAVHWDFTYNNYPEDFRKLVPLFQDNGVSYVFQQETSDSGTPHLQGYVKFPSKKRPLTVFPKNVMAASWRVVRNVPDCIAYCSDPSKRDSNCKVYANMPYPRPLKLIEPTFDWQREILSIIDEEPDDRTIHWYWSVQGGVGKTCFCKWLIAKRNATILGGKGADVRNGVVSHYKATGCYPDLCLMNIPRTFNKEYVSYEAFENIKDMMFYSGKYEGMGVNGNNPHVFIFANHEPDREEIDPERWRVVEIE